MKPKLMACLAIVVFASHACSADEGKVAGDKLYRQAVEDARAGRTVEALGALRLLVERFPDRQDILGDYVVVLGWAGHHDKALERLDRIDRARAQSYVIEGLASSARRLQRFVLAESLYREAIARFPNRVEPQVGLVLTLADEGKTTADKLYRQAVEDARVSPTPEALGVLRSLVDAFPDRQDILGDYVVVLGWANDHAAALERLDRINRASAPSYVIESLANSARRLKRFELAESLYRQEIVRFADLMEPQVGLALTLAEAGKHGEAVSIIARLRAQFPRRIDVLEAAAKIDTSRRN